MELHTLLNVLFISYILLHLYCHTSKVAATVDKLNLSEYVGRWYQVYGNNFDQLFEKFASCITADYKLNTDGNVGVINSQYENNKIVQIKGYAYYGDKNNNPVVNPGQLTVHLEGVPRDSPYWIYELGPVNSDQYEWAIVSDPLFLSLFVLARNVTTYYQNYDELVLSILDNYGFKDLVKISHTDCVYSNKTND